MGFSQFPHDPSFVFFFFGHLIRTSFPSLLYLAHDEASIIHLILQMQRTVSGRTPLKGGGKKRHFQSEEVWRMNLIVLCCVADACDGSVLSRTP